VLFDTSGSVTFFVMRIYGKISWSNELIHIKYVEEEGITSITSTNSKLD